MTNIWSQKADFGGTGRLGATGFSLAGKGYIGTGSDTNGDRQDFWAYDPTTNTWTQKADFGGTARSRAVGFSIDTKGYIGTGYDATARNDLWEYDPVSNTWTQKAAFGGTGRDQAVGFAIGTKGYIGTGYDSNRTYDFWEYTPTSPTVQLAIKVILDGPYNSATGLMNDALRTHPDFPITEPYTTIGYLHVGGGGETIPSSSVLNVTGNNAIVDWVVVELRAATNSATRVATKSALLQRDGDVVSVDGNSPVQFTQASGNYYVAVRHRNHLGVMTALSLPLSNTPTAVDFSNPGTLVYGTEARRSTGGTFPAQALWAGDVNFNGLIKYTGTGNDRDPILNAVGSTTPNNTVSVYSIRDVNLNGVLQYTGAGNDRDPILVTVGSTTPNNIRVQQLP